MTKKHYELIARNIRTGMKAYGEPDNNPLWDLAHDLAKAFAKDNPQFNETRFLLDCGVSVQVDSIGKRYKD